MTNNTTTELERRYGARSSSAIERFGESYVNGLAGWQFSPTEIRTANQTGQLLTMDLDFPGSRCKLNCTYCFAKAGEKTGTYYRQDKGDVPLSIEEIKRAILEAKALGLQSVKIIGYREPFDNPGFYDFLDFTSSQDIHTVVFTSAYTLGEREFGGDMKKAIDFLAKRPISLMIKLHTLNRNNEDKIVRSEGYSQTRDRYLKALLNDGRFTGTSPTRLGIENVIASSNPQELLEMYEYFKIWKNVFIDIDPPIPVGRTGTLEEAEKAGLLPQEKLKELCIDIYQINEKFGIPFDGISPYFGGPPCSQLPNGLYVTLSGAVNPCCGGIGTLGNVRKTSLKTIFENNPWRAKLRERVYHSCPFREERKIMTAKFIKDVEKRLKS